MISYSLGESHSPQITHNAHHQPLTLSSRNSSPYCSHPIPPSPSSTNPLSCNSTRFIFLLCFILSCYANVSSGLSFITMISIRPYPLKLMDAIISTMILSHLSILSTPELLPSGPELSCFELLLIMIPRCSSQQVSIFRQVLITKQLFRLFYTHSLYTLIKILFTI